MRGLWRAALEFRIRVVGREREGLAKETRRRRERKEVVKWEATMVVVLLGVKSGRPEGRKGEVD
jgi:hypothetical protein